MGNLKKHQKEHPILTAAFLIMICLPIGPMVATIVYPMGILWPKPDFWQIILAIPLISIAAGFGIFVGGFIFLLVSKPFVKREIMEPFYIYPGVPIASQLSSTMFNWIYGNHPNEK